MAASSLFWFYLFLENCSGLLAFSSFAARRFNSLCSPERGQRVGKLRFPFLARESALLDQSVWPI